MRKHHEKPQDHVRQMKELIEEWIQDWEKVIHRGAKEDVQGLDGWLHPWKFHELNPISLPPHEWSDRGNDSIFLNNFDSKTGGKGTLEDVCTASKSLLGNKQRDPSTTWPPFSCFWHENQACWVPPFVLFDRGTYNATIKGEGWHGKGMVYFASNGIVGSTNVTWSRHCRGCGGTF